MTDLLNNFSKYRLVLGGDLVKDFHPDTIKHLVQLWVEESGVKNVSGGCIRCDVDHVSGDGLDNRRKNLRLATCSQNQANARKFCGKHRYKGVYRPMNRSQGIYRMSRKRKEWAAQMGPERTYLGLFETEEQAARAYDWAAFARWGSYAHLNFPKSVKA